MYKRQPTYNSYIDALERLYVIQNINGWSRNKTMTSLCVFGAAVSMIYATAMGSYILGIADTFVNQIAILIGVRCV